MIRIFGKRGPGALPGPIKAVGKPAYIGMMKGVGIAKKRVRLMRMAGDAVECPFCGGKWKSWVPSGVLEREFWRAPEARALLQHDYITLCNRLCPKCKSSERHRLAYFYLRDKLKFGEMKGVKVLDVAPDVFVTRTIFNRDDIDYESVDISRANATHRMDITDLQIPDNTYDAITCYHVLEHILDDRKAMSELYRVLKPGGWAILQVPIWAEETFEDHSIERKDYLKYYGHSDHVRRYGPDFKDRLESVGFKVTLDGYVRTLPQEQLQKFGLLPTEDIHYCEKVASS